MSCLDDDAQGQPLEVLWEKEVDPEIITGEAWQDIAATGFDPPKIFSAYLHTLQWNCVTVDRPQPLPVAVPGGHPDRRLPARAAAQGPAAPAREPLHRRRRGAGQDDRGGADRPRAAAPQEGPGHRRRLPAVDALPVAGRARGPLRDGLPDPGQGVHRPGPPGAGLRGQPLDDAHAVPRLAPAPDRRVLHRDRSATGSATSARARC